MLKCDMSKSIFPICQDYAVLILIQGSIELLFFITQVKTTSAIDIDTSYLLFQTHIKASIKLENPTNLIVLNYENLKHRTFLKHVAQKMRVETGKYEL